MFKKTNPHPQGLIVRDCVKRACCLASEINYHDISVMLNRYKKITHAKSFNSDDNWRLFIINVLLGKDNGNMQYLNNGRRFKVKEYAPRKMSKCICQVANHVVAINGKGDYLDTWDSGEKSIYKVYDIPPYEAIVKNIRDNYPRLCKGLTLEKQTRYFVGVL